MNKFLCISLFLTFYGSNFAFAQDIQNAPATLNNLNHSNSNLSGAASTEAGQSSQTSLSSASSGPAPTASDLDPDNHSVDSVALLEQQQSTPVKFEPISFDDLESMPQTQVDSAMANEIFEAAEAAKRDAQSEENAAPATQQVTTINNSSAEISAINQAPVNIDNLMQQIQADQQINVQANTTARTLNESSVEQSEADERPGFFRRILNRIRPSRARNMVRPEPRITAQVEGAPEALANNIKAKLSSYTQEAFSDFNASLPQLRSLSNEAAQAVGYYQATFRFERVSSSQVRVVVTPNEPVKVAEQNIEFSGQGATTPQFQVIRLVPDLDEGDIFNHGEYNKTKQRIVDAASDNGYFDSYWRMHDVRVNQPQNTANVNLKYETGDRYSLGRVEFKMSDPNKPLPIDLDVLASMVPWQAGDDYAFWRVNTLANNLTNSRYFNYTLVDTVKPDPISKPLELPPDLKLLVEQQRLIEQQNPIQDPDAAFSDQEVTQNVADESQFAGTQPSAQDGESEQENLARSQSERAENERLQAEARDNKQVPVIVTLNADRLNSIETGFGYGTDTEFRIRTQYRRAIVNRRGHSFDANMEFSKIRQAIDGRYTIPYKHPVNDFINIVGGYEREERDDIGPDVNLETESVVVGAERIIKNPLGGWQRSFGFRYRLDELTQHGVIDNDDIPDAFRVPGADSQQESLLFGYEISKTISNNSLNPTRGFKQIYKAELGSESLLSDADMAIISLGWRFIYSLGETDDHQLVGRSDVNYIFTNDFDKVPYNLRFFAGGDQTLRGFDYKSLSPEEYGYKIGGQALAVGSLEYNYQFKEGWRAAVFTDFGNAYDEKFNNPTEYSLGLGIRWSSPIGPLRLDVASGISDDNHPIRLHFFIGPQL